MPANPIGHRSGPWKPHGTCNHCGELGRVWRVGEYPDPMGEGWLGVRGVNMCRACIAVVVDLAMAGEFDDTDPWGEAGSQN